MIVLPAVRLLWILWQGRYYPCARFYYNAIQDVNAVPLAQRCIQSPCVPAVFIQVAVAADSLPGLPTTPVLRYCMADAVLCFAGTFYPIKAPLEARCSV